MTFFPLTRAAIYLSARRIAAAYFGFPTGGIIPAEYGRVVSMITFQDKVFVACEFCVCELVEEQLTPIIFTEKTQGMGIGVNHE